MKINNSFLISLLILLILLFGFSLFKNISYPLLWNDESITVMLGKRVLNYGYPKVHDEKNIIYHFFPDPNLGVWRKIDANIDGGWTQYYFSTIGIKLSEFTDDIYLKTALLRIPFAVIGLAGLIIFAIAISQIFSNKKERITFFILFSIFELFSISLILHLREVRYYSIVIFLYSLLIYLFIKFNYLKNIKRKTYNVILILLLLLLLNTFYTSFIIFILILLIYEGIKFIRNILQNKNYYTESKKLLQATLPIFISILIATPFTIFYKIIPILKALSELKHFNLSTYFSHINTIVTFFYQYEFLYLALIIKLVLTYLLFFKKKKILINFHKIKLSNFFLLLFIIYILLIAKMPYLYERYFIYIQPILIGMIIIDIFILYELLLDNIKKTKKYFYQFLFILIVFGLIFKINIISEHLYELNQPYYGPVDYVINYLKEKFVKPENLIIATNYEETSYMYYLGSKVIIGYARANLKEDLKKQPDIIIYRKYNPGDPGIFNYFLQNNKYNKIIFPVSDYFVNNMPDTCCHLFRTKMPENRNQNLIIFVKQKESD
ncbi:hypothetical protein KJ840_04480 [Patescibacteria group bacterium]|nr:hypothetical protein [Patescibacteria group bacterium]